MNVADRLGEEFVLNGFTYKVIKRVRDKILTAQYNDAGMCVAHELAFVMVLPAGKVFNKEYPEREHYPSNEEVGTYAWSITNDREEALQRFDDFVKFKKKKK